MSKKPAVHVVPRNDGWAVERDGAQRASKVTDTQQQAIDAARDMARNDKTELMIHGRDGQIRSRDSYGNDPCPPKDKDN